MSLEAAERETVFNMSDADDMIFVSTSQRTMVTQLLKIPAFETVEDYVFEGTRHLVGKLPLGSLTVRKAAKGSIKRTPSATTRKGMPANAAKCGYEKADGAPCGSLASKEHGRCARHKGL